MVKKQWLFLLILVILSSFVYGLTIQTGSEPADNESLTSNFVTFKCNLGADTNTTSLVQYKFSNWSNGYWINTSSQKVSSYFGELEFTSNLIEGSWDWKCVANTDTEYYEGDVKSFFIVVNQPPSIVGEIPNQNKSLGTESWILDLSSYESDDSSTGLYWEASNVDSNFCNISFVGSIATFTKITNSAGSDSITLTLVDSEGLTDSQEIMIYFYSTDTNDSNTAPICSSIGDISWYKNDDKTLNLGNYCSDSDGDSLIYINHSSLEHISISISGDQITFKPEEDWTGSENIRFNVSDGKSSILTNEFSVQVEEQSSSSSSNTTNVSTAPAVVILTLPNPNLNFVNMYVKDSKKFSVKLKNLVEDVVYKWFLGGSKIIGASSSNYMFKPIKSGIYELKVEAKKGLDSDFRMWTINVSDKAEKKVVVSNITNTTNDTKNIEVKSGFSDWISGFSVKNIYSGNNKWYLVGVGGSLLVLIASFVIFRTKRKKGNLQFYGKKEGIFKRIRRKLAERELKKREPKRLKSDSI